jgi:hypothetical protein
MDAHAVHWKMHDVDLMLEPGLTLKRQCFIQTATYISAPRFKFTAWEVDPTQAQHEDFSRDQGNIDEKHQRALLRTAV